MIGQSLVFACVAVAIAAGSCLESCNVQGVAQQIVAAPVLSSNVLSTGTVGRFYSAPISSFGSSLVADSTLSSLSIGGIAESSLPITDGPSGTPITVIQAPSVTLPAVESPVVTLSSEPIPAPRVISQRCVCTKTIVKPQIIQRQVTVPKLQRYFKRTVTPIVENFTYKSTPYSRGSSTVSGVSSSAVSDVSSSPVSIVASSLVSSRSRGFQVGGFPAAVVSSRSAACGCY